MKYMNALTIEIEQYIRVKLPDIVGALLGGRTETLHLHTVLAPMPSLLITKVILE